MRELSLIAVGVIAILMAREYGASNYQAGYEQARVDILEGRLRK